MNEPARRPNPLEAVADDAVQRARVQRLEAEVEAHPQYDPDKAIGFVLEARGNNHVVMKLQGESPGGILLSEAKTLGRFYRILHSPETVPYAWGERPPNAMPGDIVGIAGVPMWHFVHGLAVYTIQDHQILFVVHANKETPAR